MKKNLFLTLLLLMTTIAYSPKAELPDCIEEFLFEDLELPFGEIGENAPNELVQDKIAKSCMNL